MRQYCQVLCIKKNVLRSTEENTGPSNQIQRSSTNFATCENVGVNQWNRLLHRGNHELTRKPDSNVSNTYSHQASLLSRSFAVSPFGPILGGGGGGSSTRKVLNVHEKVTHDEFDGKKNH